MLICQAHFKGFFDKATSSGLIGARICGKAPWLLDKAGDMNCLRIPPFVDCLDVRYHLPVYLLQLGPPLSTQHICSGRSFCCRTALLADVVGGVRRAAFAFSVFMLYAAETSDRRPNLSEVPSFSQNLGGPPKLSGNHAHSLVGWLTGV